MHLISIIALTFLLNILCEAAPVDWNAINYAVDWNTINYGNAGGAAAATQAAVTQAAAPAVTSLTVNAAAATTSKAASASPKVQTNNKVVATSSSSPKSASSSSSKAASSGSSSSGSSNGYSSSLSGSGIAFSQYGNDGKCKSSTKLAQAIKALSSYSVIRLYDVDCDLVSVALENKGSNQKLLVGIYDPTKVSSGIETITKAVNKKGKWSDIYGVTIGNEHVNDGKYTASQMASYVSQAKSKLSGHNVKVAAVDVYSTIWSNKDLCNGDFVAANAHPYFDGSSEPSNCGKWLESQISKLKGICSGKDVLITETGWPTAGGNRASKSNQNSCLNSIKSSSSNKHSLLFSAWNEAWKDGTLEQSWGIKGADPY